MSNLYYISHVGVSQRDGAPGRGSGRYALGTGKRPYQYLESGLKGGAKTLESEGRVRRAINRMKKTSSVSKMDVSKMTDNELRNVIGRMDMERRYKDLVYEREQGAIYVDDLLDSAAGALQVAAGLTTIATSIYLITHQ